MTNSLSKNLITYVYILLGYEDVYKRQIMFAALGTVNYGNREISYLQEDRAKRTKTFWEIELLSCLLYTSTSEPFLSASFTMVLNLNMRNFLPYCVIRSCLKKTGPGTSLLYRK